MCDHFQNVEDAQEREKLVVLPSAVLERQWHTVAADYRSLVIQSHTNSMLIDDFACVLCSRVVNRPIQLTVCNKVIWLACLCKSLDEREFCCPCCGSDHLKDHHTMVQPSPIVMKILGDFQVSCSKCKKKKNSSRYKAKAWQAHPGQH